MTNVETSRTPRTRRPTITRKDLDKELEDLRADDADVRQQLRRTHDAHRQHLAAIYLWWRKTDQHPGYLDAICEERGIQFKKTNQPNFNAVIRAVCQFDDPDQNDRVTISQWAKKLREMHEYYVANEPDLKHNPAGKLAAFIKESSRVEAISNESDEDEDEDENDDARRAPPSDPELIAPEVHAAVVQRSIDNLKRQAAIGQITTTKPVRVGKDGLLVSICRADEHGVVVLGTTNDPLVIENAASSAAEKNFAALPHTLRVLAEPIQSQAIPPHSLPSSAKQRRRWIQEHYNERAEIRESDLPGWTEKGKGKWLRSSKQLRLRRQELILSGNRLSASPVTRLSLSEPIIEPEDSDYFLRVLQGADIERQLNTGEIGVLQVENANSLPPNTTGGPAAYKLPVTNPVTKRTKHLHFYRIPPENNTRFQADFCRDKFAADWTANVPPSFCQEVRQGWADPWFAGLGQHNQIIRDLHATLQVKVTRQAFTILYNLGLSSATFQFPTEVEVSTEELTSYFSKDLGPVLFNLADALVTDQITLAGNRHALVIRYATEIGNVEIAVPTLAETKKDKAKRDGTLFCAIGKKP